MSTETSRKVVTSVDALLEDLKGRENVYKMTRLENFKVEPFQDGIRISGSEGTQRHQIDMEGPKFYEFAGVPEKIQGKLTRSLLASVAQELLHTEQAGRFSILSASEKPVCFQTYGAPYVSPHSVLQTLVTTPPLSGGQWIVGDLNIKPDHVDIDIYNEIFSAEPKVGDVVRLGLHMSLYDSMHRPTTVEGYSHRLFCANGAHIKYNNRGFTIHADASPTAVVEQIVQRSSRLLAELPAIVERESRALMNTQVANPVVAINRIAQDLNISSNGHTYERVQEAFVEEPGNTLWEIFQAFTRAANSLESYDARTSLRASAGKLLEQATRARCSGCYRLTH
jgi:hypothetical protein